MMEGAPCTLDVTTEKSTLTFHIDGERQTYSLANNRQQLFK